jgi:hypothetical protein
MRKELKTVIDSNFDWVKICSRWEWQWPNEFNKRDRNMGVYPEEEIYSPSFASWHCCPGTSLVFMGLFLLFVFTDNIDASYEYFWNIEWSRIREIVIDKPALWFEF